MKKLYRKGTVHPSPPIISDHLAFLPATILTLTVALSPEEKEVLAYLISCSSSSNGNPRRTTKAVVDHPPVFHCSCFRCYTNYWVRWDNSPNNQLIHEIIDAFEDSLAQTSKRKDKRYKKGSNKKSPELKRSEVAISSMDNASVSSSSSAELESASSSSSSTFSDYNTSCGDDDVGKGIEDEEKGSVRRFVSFIGERIWSAWGSVN